MDKKVSMSRSERLRREKVTRYSIRKYSFGAASVAVAALFMFLGNGAVSANENGTDSQGGAAVAASPNGGGEADPGDGAPSTGAENGGATAGSEVPAATNDQPPVVEIPYSNTTEREIYVYGAEETSFEIKIKDDAGRIKEAKLLKGGNQSFQPVPNEPDKINTEYGYKANVFTSETDATNEHPAVIRYSGTPAPDGKFTQTRLEDATRGENPTGTNLGWRYVRVRDTNNVDFTGSDTEKRNDHAFNVVLKPQKQKYDVKDLTGSQRITVNDIDNITEDELGTIKSRLQLEYSKTNTDARLQNLAGTDVNNPSQLIKAVAVSPTDSTKLAVTYNDGSVDTIEKNKVLNVRPKGIIPFSNPAEKRIYVYKGEETNLEFGVTDDSGKIKDLRIVQAKGVVQAKGAAQGQVKNQYGLIMTSQTDTDGINATADSPAITRIRGTVDVPNQPRFVGKLMTRYLVAEDLEGAVFSPPLQNSNLEQEGAFELFVREQTQKYALVSPTNEADKIVVSDPDSLSEDELTKIKENIKLKYSTADDARLSDKNNTEVENASNYIKSVTQQGDQLVVTYNDGSTDSVPLTSVVKLDKQPAIDAVNTAAEEQINAINGNAEATQEEKDAAIAKVNADKEKALAAINDPSLTTKAALDQAQTAGTTAIAADNPVVAKKAEAKAAIEAARKAKEDAINADRNLSEAEKTAAIAKANEAAQAATEKIDAATTDAEVAKAKEAGESAVGAVTPVAKDAAKKAVADELAKKEAEIDARQDLTAEEKAKAKAEAQAAADEANQAIDAQPEVAATPEEAQAAQDKVDAAKTQGVEAIKAVNPETTAKAAADKAIDDALAAKNKAIDERTDLTDAEKKAAKDKAKEEADKAKAAVAAATSDAEVAKAKEAGESAVGAVTPVAKDAAKKAVADELAKKEAEIDARQDLTAEEKDAAKKEAQAKAAEANKAIDAQPDVAATPEEAKAAQDKVEAAKTQGVEAIKAVNPETTAKAAADKAIDDALAAKNKAIDERTDLTDAEKKAAKDKAKEEADKAKAAVAAATSDAEVAKAKEAGESAVGAVTPVAKDAAKKAVADELAKKEAEIDARQDLTAEEKAKVKAEAQARAAEANQAIDAQPDVTTTPEESRKVQGAVDSAKEHGVAAIKAVNPETTTKAAAKKAIDDKLAEQLKAIENTPDATDEEKAEAAEKATALAKEAKQAIDIATTDSEVKKLQDDANAEIGKVLPVVEDKPNARKAIDEQTKAKKEEIDARTDLSPKAKENLKDKADQIAAEAKKLVDAANKEADVNKIQDADKSAIRAVGDINRPIDKVLVNDPANLKAEEKAKILEEVKKVNPTAKEVKYNDAGNIEVTTANGDKGIINPTDLVKTLENLDNGKGGNDINKPLDKVIIKDKSMLTESEKAQIIAAVKSVNPNSIVLLDADGTVSVSTPEGHTATIPSTELVRTKEDTAKSDAGNGEIVKPADKVVGEPTDSAAQAKVEEKLRKLNPEAKSVKFDDKGNATVTLNDGTVATIPWKDLFKSPEDATKPNAGNDIVKPADKAVVANSDKLTVAEKKAIEEKVKAVNPGATVVVDDKGNATVTTPEGKTAVIPATDLTKSAADAAKPNAGNDVNTPAAKTVAANLDKLTDAEKKAIEEKVKAVNPGSTVVVDDKGNATVTTPEGKTAVIPATDLVKTQDDITKENAGNDVNTPAAKTVVADPDALTPEEKRAIEEKVKAVNSGSTVVVDDKGNATVTKADGTVLNIPALDLVIPAGNLADEAKTAKVKTPAFRTLVGNKDNLTEDEKAAVKKAIEAVNSGATVVVDDKGNATVTLDGNTVSIAKDQLVKTESDVTAKNSGDNINLDFEKETVADFTNLTDSEKEAAKAKIKAANADAVDVLFDKAGNATVVTKDGKVLAITAEAIFKQAPSAQNNAANNTDAKADKAKLEGAIHQLDELIIQESAKLDAETAKEANDLLADAKKVFANADASQDEVDAMVKRIEDFMAKVAPSTNHTSPAKDQAAQTPAVAPATAQAANVNQAAANARTVAKELPNTGTADSTVAMVAAAASALLGLGLAGRRRKEDEEA
ncbi:surface anchored protein [Streptococcus pseudopneumoniae]|uniref:YSIRK signal domain/LPXTG anchor domain surface protein n=2 Tax=Streptococcus pseudopneumoniae TaxID=257758 RepID=UPI0005DE3E05|nr:YSIRK signal domain/LPXTG anchor domain surface protein [Streptococcus pseudopneumoniae]CJZ07717.1 surface anchored protein [Streptococcus pseudopneumoniae]